MQPLVVLLLTMTALANAECTATAPALERHHTAIFVAGPILWIMAVIFMCGINLAMKRTQATIPMCLLWAIGGTLSGIWFWAALGAGFAPEYLVSKYIPANASLLESSIRTFKCTEQINCVCAQSFDEPCTVVRNRLLEDNVTTSQPCAGDSCCSREIFRCTRTKTTCSGRNNEFCTTTCSIGFYECVLVVSASRCTAIEGTCTEGVAKYGFPTVCGENSTREYRADCGLNDDKCVSDFKKKYIDVDERTVYYAPWNINKQADQAPAPKGQIANIVLPLLFMLCIIAMQIIAIFMSAKTGADSTGIPMRSLASSSDV
jgi:hypothetical protein